MPLWLTLLLVGRDVLLALTLPLLRRHGYGALPVHYLGKAATFNLLCGFPLLLLGEWENARRRRRARLRLGVRDLGDSAVLVGRDSLPAPGPGPDVRAGGPT